ncbi:MAG: hypothetical protein K2X44_08125, partial [Magnetospirillum sp.]|nr:hypothetical protein [Magnetospirillum sp.]
GTPMEFEDVRASVVEIISAANGRFLTAYQICQRIEQSDPELWQTIVTSYPSSDPDVPMGAGAGRHYSPASFVANSLRYFLRMGMIPGLRLEWFECEGVSFSGVDPGYTGNVVGIWAIQDAAPAQ